MARRILLIDIGSGLTLSGVLPSVALFGEYSARLIATGGAAPYTYTIVSGSLPAGLFLDAGTGTISGASTVAGRFAITVRATDLNGSSTDRPFLIQVIAEPLALVGAAPDGIVGVTQTYTYTVAGGVPPYSFALIGAPAGWSLPDPSMAQISYLPLSAGTKEWAIRVTDAEGTQQTIDDSIEVSAATMHVYTFSTSGSFTVPAGVNLRMLAVGGGAAGGAFGGGGGGGGGVAALTRTLAAGTYSVTVGIGGAAVTSSHVGNDGGTSSISTFLSATGGKGGKFGGGGEPGGDSGAGYVDGALAFPSYPGNDPGSAGGGGGAAQAGGSSAEAGGIHFGGNGYLWTPLNVYFGGGGGGSNSSSNTPWLGGLGGGGNGGYSLSSPQARVTAGTDGLGGGGGGAWTGTSAKGGNGTVIVISPVALTHTGTVVESEIT